MVKWKLGVLVGLIAAAGGCGSADRAYRVTGEVRFAGSPVDEGNIQFECAENRHATMAGRIDRGRYDVALPPGPKRVRITAARPVPGKKIPDGSGEFIVPREDYIPPEYNTHTTLTVEVVPRRQELDFHLEPSEN